MVESKMIVDQVRSALLNNEVKNVLKLSSILIELEDAFLCSCLLVAA